MLKAEYNSSKRKMEGEAFQVEGGIISTKVEGWMILTFWGYVMHCRVLERAQPAPDLLTAPLGQSPNLPKPQFLYVYNSCDSSHFAGLLKT